MARLTHPIKQQVTIDNNNIHISSPTKNGASRIKYTQTLYRLNHQLTKKKGPKAIKYINKLQILNFNVIKSERKKQKRNKLFKPMQDQKLKTLR